MTAYLFSGGRLLDPRAPELREGIEVLVENDRVREVSDRRSRRRVRCASTCAAAR